MQILLKKTTSNRRAEKTTILRRNGNDIGSIFSYTIKSKLPTITLHQKETGFSLTLEVEKLGETLRVTRFTLKDNPFLAKASEDLDEAARIEIVLQSLKCLFSHVERHEMLEILFILSQKEAFHQLSFFESLFTEISPMMLGNERRVALTLSYLYQDYFLEHIADTKARIYQELWVRQREDGFLRDYLQGRHKKDFSLFQDNSSPEPQSSDECMIIAFPKSGHI